MEKLLKELSSIDNFFGTDATASKFTSSSNKQSNHTCSGRSQVSNIICNCFNIFTRYHKFI
jgi:hypothetical protein